MSIVKQHVRRRFFAQFSNVDHPLRVFSVEYQRGFDAPVADTVVLARRNNPEKNSVRWIRWLDEPNEGLKGGLVNQGFVYPSR